MTFQYPWPRESTVDRVEHGSAHMTRKGRHGRAVGWVEYGPRCVFEHSHWEMCRQPRGPDAHVRVRVEMSGSEQLSVCECHGDEDVEVRRGGATGDL